MAKKLTDAFVRNATGAGITWDTTQAGLGLKVLPTGKKVWVLQTIWPEEPGRSKRSKPSQAKRNIGAWPDMSLEEALRRAETLRSAAKNGRDLLKEEAAAKEAAERDRVARANNTFGAVAERYIGERTNRRAEQDAREIRRLLVTEWGDKPIGEIMPRDVRRLIDEIKVRAPYDARNAWTHLTGIFKLAVHDELIDASPVASLDRKLIFKNVRIAPRQRVLSDDEVLALWRASGRLGYPAGPIYRLLALTGCRVGEIARARWSELHPELRRTLREAARAGERVDWSAVPDSCKTLTIPRERFKSDAEHVVQLTDAACEVLEGVPRFAGSDHLFTTDGESSTWLGAKHKARLDARMLRTLRAVARRRGDDPGQARMEPWVQHDIRRVVRTNLSALDVADHVAEMVIGHGRTGLQRVYDQHKYGPQIREALERWAGRLREMAEFAPTVPPAGDPSNVVTFRRTEAAR